MRLRRRAAALRAHLPSRLPWEPWSVLVPLVLAEWIGIALVTQRVHHNGWLFAQDRATSWTFTTSWILGGGHIPHTLVGYGLPLLLAPVTWITGPSFVSALHVVLPLQVLLLPPLAALGAYALGARSGGRLIGYASAAIWTLGPFLSLWYFAQHRLWRDHMLPTLLGLTQRPELPAAVALLAAGVLVLRALDERRLVDAAAAGVAAGFAIAIKPTDVLFLAAPVVAFAAARRPRALGAFALGLAPCALTFVLWSERAVGHASLLLPAPAHFSRALFDLNTFYVLQVTWSPRVLEWIAVAGFVGLAKHAPVKALFFGTWLAAFVLGEGAERAQADGLAFWHLLVPAFPAYCVLTASLPLLWPRADRRLPERFPYRPRRLLPAAAPALVFLLVPLAAVAASTPQHGRHTAARLVYQLVPLDRGVQASGRTDRSGVTLSWRPVEKRPPRFLYAIYRSPERAGSTLEGVLCTRHRSAADDCALEMTRVGATTSTAFADKPHAGTFTYRVVVSAHPGTASIPLFVGPPVNIRVR